MKNLFLTCFLILTSQLALTQNIEECKKIVDLTIEALNKGSAENLDIYLTDDFSIAGKNGAIAKVILQKLFSQLDDQIISHHEIEQSKIDNGLELVYKTQYNKMGLKEARFIFDENNLIKELSLFSMQVKTLNANNTKIEKSSKDVIEVPFFMVGNLIGVKVLLEGEYKTFILDSGASKVILNSKYIATEYDERKTISSSNGVGGSIAGMDITKVAQLDFNGIQLNNQEVLTLDLSHLEESLETEIFGLIGYPIIKDYDIIFDYKKLKLTLINPAIFESYKNEKLSDLTLEPIPLVLEGHIPIVKAQVGTETYSYGIDCGAESNLISESLFESLKKYTRQTKTTELIGVDNRLLNVQEGKIKKTTIGTKSLKNLKTIFSDISHLDEAFKSNIDGLIGYQVLSNQRTLISYDRKEMIFLE